MISFDFEYYRPSTIDEAVNIFKSLKEEGKKPVYYAGGTELICRARLDQISFDAAIDIKEIPECNVMEFQNDTLVTGAVVTLTKISEAGIFPLLGEACKAAADHTARDKITLGGNICGQTVYREALLPFLITDSIAIIAGVGGLRNVPVNQFFNQSLQLTEGEFLVQLKTEKCFIISPYIYKKKTRHGKVDYPLAAIASIYVDGKLRIALTGVCAFSFRSNEVEESLNDEHLSLDNRIKNVISRLPSPIINDMLGSAEYRELVLTNMLGDTLSELTGVM